MARIAFAFAFSLLLVLAIQSAVRADPSVPVADQMGQAAASVKGAAESMAASATDAAEDAKDTASSWSSWFSDKIEGLGIYNPDDDKNGRAAAPKSA